MDAIDQIAAPTAKSALGKVTLDEAAWVATISDQQLEFARRIVKWHGSNQAPGWARDVRDFARSLISPNYLLDIHAAEATADRVPDLTAKMARLQNDVHCDTGWFTPRSIG